MTETVVVTDNTPTVVVTPQVSTIVVSAPGPQGPVGPSGSSAVFYVHTQNTASATWTINHNLQGHPTVVVHDSAGTQVEGTFSYPSTDTMVVTFSAAFSGVAYII